MIKCVYNKAKSRRDSVKITKISLAALLLAFCALLCACGQTTLTKPQIIAYVEDLPSASKVEVVFNVKDDVFGKTLTVYSKADHKANELASVKKRFGLDDALGLRYGDYKQYKNGDGAVIKVYKTGAFEYSCAKQQGSVTLADTQLREKAEAILAELNISLDGFEYSGVTAAVTEEENCFLKKLYYTQKIDGYKVIGASKIEVGFSNNEVYSIGMLYNDREKAFDIVSKGYDEVAEGFVNDIISINYDNDLVKSGMINRLEVTSAEIVYFDKYSQTKTEQAHIQPCYSFSGTAYTEEGVETGFNAIISAVPDKYFS